MLWALPGKTWPGSPTDLGNLSRQSPSISLILDHLTRRGLNVMLVARDKKALENLAEEVRAEGVQAKVVVEDFAKEGAVSRVVEKVLSSSIYRVFQKECQKLKNRENLNFYINLVFSAVLGPELADILSPTAFRSTTITPRHP